VNVFFRFAAVGVAGFVVDTAVLYAVKGMLGLYLGRIVSYLAAATLTWALNRRFTFVTATHAPKFKQWLEFLVANVFGAIVNYGVYSAAVTWTIAGAFPVLGVAAGSIAGLAVNFTVNKRWVFAER
jgi:putative flippase GtrA